MAGEDTTRCDRSVFDCQDVIHTIRWTRSQGLPLSVRGAGHEIFGRSLIENGVIDLFQMKTVTVDPTQRTPNSSWLAT